MGDMLKAKSKITSQMPAKGISYDFIDFGYNREICTGMWMIRFSRYVIDQVRSDFEEDVYSRIEQYHMGGPILQKVALHLIFFIRDDVNFRLGSSLTDSKISPSPIS